MQPVESASHAVTLAQELVERWPYAASATAALVAGLLAQYLLKPDPLAGIPIVGKGGVHQRRKFFMSGRARELYFEGYQKVFNATNALFRITSARESEIIVIDPKYAKELAKVPDEFLSFTKAIEESMQEKYIHLAGNAGEFLPHTIKANLTPALGRLNPVLAQEVRESMEVELPQTSEWTEFVLSPKLYRIVAQASGRIFIGPELCRKEEYLDAAINYTIDVMIAVFIVLYMPTWLRPLLAPWVPQVRKLKQRRQKAKDFLVPIITARRKAAAENPNYQPPDDMLQWMDDDLTKQQGKRPTVEDLAIHQLGISFAAIHTTTSTVTNIIYTLAAMPELIPILRDDVKQALEETDGVFTSLALQNMKKLDSFMKENLRFYSMSAGSFQRKVLQPFQLSNGQAIPAGVIIELPQCAVNADASVFPDADKFDAMRYYKLRQSKEGGADPSPNADESETKAPKLTGAKAAEVTASSQFVSVSPSSLTFGLGRHACPGRFFAANEIKMILSVMLLHYDIALPEGETERFENITRAHSSMPDPKKPVRMRKL
ncbi:cytochrome P450 [Microdochium bolleyi]|uniref:Cytochrome P450 n=1 Tax=Microdochium bolleyi TaxID=196109 RepID=A0A136JCD3_9PEZI|nr:cytochrome P450 [Microdochium bolleyi]